MPPFSYPHHSLVIICSFGEAVRTEKEKDRAPFKSILILGVYDYICTIAMIWLCVKRTSNVHKDRTQESRNTKNTYEFLVQVRNFLLPLSLKIFRHKEREAQSFYPGFFICPPLSQNVWHPRQKPLAWLRRASESQTSSSKAGHNSTK